MRATIIVKGIALPLLGMVLFLGGTASALEDLRIPVAQTSSTTSLVEQVAIHKGWFKEIGYNARVYSVSGGENAAVLALERGQLPFFGSDDNIALAIRPGSNIKIVGTEVNTLPYWLVAGKHVKSYKDLKRPVKVGISSPTSANVYVSLKLLEAHGIPKKDARLIKVGGSGARLAGVKAGKIDVGSLTFGKMLRAKESGLQVLGSAEQFTKEYAFLQLAMNRNFIKDHHDKAVAIMGTLIRSCAYINDPKNGEVITHVLEKVMRNKPNIAKQMYEIEVLKGGAIPNRCQVTKKGVDAFIESAFWTKSIPKDTKVPPYDQITDQKFYGEALAWFNNKGWMKK